MSVLRYDNYPLPKVKRTAEGYLRGDAIVTRTGVFTYMNADGSTRRELRHPDDIHDAESLDSLKMIPITVDHPSVLVDATNSNSLSVGMTGESVKIDGQHIITSLTITGASGIDAAASGYGELSLGYRLDLEREDGVYEGESYTHRQRNVRYNHLAMVRKARAGAAARLNMDGAAILHEEDNMSEKNLSRVRIDGLSYDAEPEVERHLIKLDGEIAKLRNDAQDAAKAAVKAEAERDEHKARADKAEKDLAEARSDAAIEARVAARIDLAQKAERLVPGIKLDGKTTKQIQLEVLGSIHKGLNLDGRTDDYVAARFDAACEQVGASASQPNFAPTPRFDGQQPSDVRADAAAAESSWRSSVAKMNSRYEGKQ